MNAVPLAVPYLDTGAHQLSFALGLPAQEPLAVTDVPLPGGAGTAELRLLGASHQVFAGPVRETVACLPGRPGPLPARFREDLDGWGYTFTSHIHRYPPAAFTRRVARLRAALDDRPGSLCGVFPGSPDAFTGLTTLSGGEPGWSTWHTYPQTCEIVTTRTRLELP
ncbi:DUF2617 family protein [Streptomyces sp. ACA25]|uniref:DUF2617 family protein n=1 Tax=Streptomyces sp. ACA25 TaxID=3022596 RepID=UPI00230760C2|nr:DUF2617 family protein [Streptomyces sp. ACA25]MDB1090188.1 DUF2617 family protein [Streptomyces sp. ACA25]